MGSITIKTVKKTGKNSENMPHYKQSGPACPMPAIFPNSKYPYIMFHVLQPKRNGVQAKVPLLTESTRRIMEAIKAVPRGSVSCYRDIALKAGLPNGARQVVRVLHSMTRKYDLPWYRIIRADGRIAFGEGEDRDRQAALLRAEGIKVSKTGKVKADFYDWSHTEKPDKR
jgi:methylated-DNA-protein-cysteine methyltransferase-like protein